MDYQPHSLAGQLRKRIESIDFVLILAIILLMAYGSLVLFSASGENNRMMTSHGIHILIATGALLFASQFPGYLLNRWAIWLYLFGITLLILVKLQGVSSGGAQRWLELPGLRFQPSELMKIVVPMMVASYLSGKPLPPRFHEIIIASLIAFIPMLLILTQPDLGTALLIATSGFFVIFFAGIPWKWLGALFIGVLIAAPLLFFFGMKEYQQQRVLTLLDPAADKLGAGYHITQSTIAISSGGVYGKGWLNGDQSRLDFLPERHTDFIFAVLGEEFGLFGNLLLLALYIFIILRGLYLSQKGRDTFSRLLGGSLSLTFFMYLFVNTGMVSGLLPVVGVPLPLFSYGGTSMVTLMIAFGLIMGMRKGKREFSYKEN